MAGRPNGMQGPRLSNTEYTVGWICAIRPEHVAARCFLDEEHEGPDSRSPGDQNSYILGRCGVHNVVVVLLPFGEYGTSSATAVAKDLLHSFPNVRVGLMVGIGGGAPSRQHDVRLGDIVVSAPGSRHGGVLQYDYGKTIQGEPFRITGFLNKPPPLLATAVHALQSSPEPLGTLIEEAVVTTIRQVNPDLYREYGRPEQYTDLLYRSHFVHPHNDERRCLEICGTEWDDIVPRHPRPRDSEPAIHYGLIASGNRLMKDALIRDQLAEDEGVLCFEMEAAGLMNHFPCLVIRGICDYSDSHKNKRWQGYAAMTAAAYAKLLLGQIPISQIQAGPRSRMTKLEASINNIQVAVDDAEDKKVLEWLTQLDYADDHNYQRRKRQPGTGEWFLKSPNFQAWLEQEGQTMFCSGIPGSGKTILTSTVIDYLKDHFAGDQDVGIAYIYCNLQHKGGKRSFDARSILQGQDDRLQAEELISSLLKQIVQAMPSLPEPVRALYAKHSRDRTRPLTEEVLSTLIPVVQGCFSRRFVIVIDALDECHNSNYCRSEFLQTIFKLQKAVERTSIFVTSRPTKEIEEEILASDPTPDEEFFPEYDEYELWFSRPEMMESISRIIRYEIQAKEEDLQAYLDSQMFKFKSVIGNRVDLEHQIKERISDAVHGMFLLAPLHISALVEIPTVKGLKRALDALSTDLDETYDQAMQRIEEQRPWCKRLALRILTWLAFAEERLSPIELQHAVAIELPEASSGGDLGQRQNGLDEDSIPEMSVIGSICAGLITHDTENNVISLAHYTTNEYVRKRSSEWFPDSPLTYIAKACLTYLSFDAFSSGPCTTWEDFQERFYSHPLLEYAIQHCGEHVAKAPVFLAKEVLGFLSLQGNLEAAFQIAEVLRAGVFSETPAKMTGFHLIASYGMIDGLDYFLHNNSHSSVPLDFDSKDDTGKTPFFWAAAGGHTAAVEHLLKHVRPDVNVQDEDKAASVLHVAVWGRNEALVKLLLEQPGINPNLQDLLGRTPLHQAIRRGNNEAIVKLLLEKAEVDPDMMDYRHRTPLYQAVKGQDELIVALLLEQARINPNLTVSGHPTPLHLAVRLENEAVLRLLLGQAMIDLNCRDQWGCTPLHVAVSMDNATMVQLLLATRKVDLAAREEGGRTPLDLARERGNWSIVELLSGPGNLGRPQH